MKPLEAFSLINTRQLDEARELVARQFCQHRLTINSGPDSFHTLHHVAHGKLISLNYIQYGTSVTIEPGELQHFYLIQIPLRGHAEIHNGNARLHSNRHCAAILNPDRHTCMHWSADCEQILLYISRQVLRDFAEAYIGRTLNAELVFESQLDFNRRCFANWRAMVWSMVEAADSRQLFIENKALNQTLLEEQILIELLENQPGNLRALMHSTPRGPVPRSVKLARDYIYANAENSISLKDISAAAGVPARTLQHQFNAAGFSSPLKTLQNERLARVNFELESGHADDSVSAVAARWGFLHFGRFSHYYRSRFNELPSTTRQRCQRLRGESSAVDTSAVKIR